MIKRRLKWYNEKENKLIYTVSNLDGKQDWIVTLEFLTMSAYGFFGTLRLLRNEFVLMRGDPTRSERPVGILSSRRDRGA